MNDEIFPKIPWKKAFACVIMAIFCLSAVSMIPQAKAQFIIAWDYDSEYSTSFDYDEYGQGFYMYNLMTNYTFPAWNVHPDYVETYYFNESSYVYEWDIDYGIGIRFYVWMNSTLTGATDLTDGLDYIRLNATITGLGGTELDSQDDLTAFYQSSFWDAEMWLYGFNALFDVLAEDGVTYTATLTYEVYW